MPALGGGDPSRCTLPGVAKATGTEKEPGRSADDSAAVVERFIDRMRALDSDGAAALLAADVVYENKGLPTIHGRSGVRKFFRAIIRAGTKVELHVHVMSADGGRVLTERTDALQWGPLRFQFWVCGRFDVRNGEIVLWRDYFDYLAVLGATARGLLGVVVPAVRARPPSAA
jgi:limonene-1,2-epoxide hydrolase